MQPSSTGGQDSGISSPPPIHGRHLQPGFTIHRWAPRLQSSRGHRITGAPSMDRIAKYSSPLIVIAMKNQFPFTRWSLLSSFHPRRSPRRFPPARRLPFGPHGVIVFTIEGAHSEVREQCVKKGRSLGGIGAGQTECAPIQRFGCDPSV